jgi:hypothetical protein
LTFENLAIQEKETTLSEIEPPTQTQSPTRRWLSEPDNDDQVTNFSSSGKFIMAARTLILSGVPIFIVSFTGLLLIFYFYFIMPWL